MTLTYQELHGFELLGLSADQRCPTDTDLIQQTSDRVIAELRDYMHRDVDPFGRNGSAWYVGLSETHYNVVALYDAYRVIEQRYVGAPDAAWIENEVGILDVFAKTLRGCIVDLSIAAIDYEDPSDMIWDRRLLADYLDDDELAAMEADDSVTIAG